MSKISFVICSNLIISKSKQVLFSFSTTESYKKNILEDIL